MEVMYSDFILSVAFLTSHGRLISIAASDGIPHSMGSQGLTRFVVRKSLDLYRVMELSRPLARVAIIELSAINRYCPEQTLLQNEDFHLRQ